MFGSVINTEAHLAHAGAGLRTKNTADLSGIIEALSFLEPSGPVTRDFCDATHAANVCMGTIQPRTNVPFHNCAARSAST